MHDTNLRLNIIGIYCTAPSQIVLMRIFETCNNSRILSKVHIIYVQYTVVRHTDTSKFNSTYVTPYLYCTKLTCSITTVLYVWYCVQYMYCIHICTVILLYSHNSTEHPRRIQYSVPMNNTVSIWYSIIVFIMGWVTMFTVFNSPSTSQWCKESIIYVSDPIPLTCFSLFNNDYWVVVGCSHYDHHFPLITVLWYYDLNPQSKNNNKSPLFH